MFKSINQVAQEDGDTSLNMAREIREREAAINRAWRRIAYDQGESACTAESVASEAGLPVNLVIFVCAVSGYELR